LILDQLHVDQFSIECQQIGVDGVLIEYRSSFDQLDCDQVSIRVIDRQCLLVHMIQDKGSGNLNINTSTKAPYFVAQVQKQESKFWFPCACAEPSGKMNHAVL